MATTPATIEKRQAELNKLYAEIFENHSGKPTNKPDPKPTTILNMSDAELIDKATKAKDGPKFKALWNGDTSGYGNDDSSADFALCCLLAYWTRKDPAQMDSLFRQSGLMQDPARIEKWNERHGAQTYGAMSIEKAIEGTSRIYEGKTYGKKNRLHSVKTPLTDDDKPSIITTARQLCEVSDEALRALEKGNLDEQALYVRSGSLVIIRIDEKGSPRIQLVTETILRGHLSRAANFFKVKKSEDGENYTPVNPPLEIAKDILEGGRYPFPPLVSIIEAPVLRPDGSILDRPGYDEKTSLYYKPAPGLTIPPVPSKPTKDEVLRAKEAILEVFEEFNFKDAGSKAGALALILTPILRNALFPACAPLFLLDAPQAGSGKTLQAKICSIITTGNEGNLMSPPRLDEEWKKSISTLLLGGKQIVIVDNIEYPLSSASLATVLTATGWEDRLLGTLTTVTVPNLATWIGTGNNIRVRGDLARRCVWIRIDPDAPKPWKRRGFKHPNLLDWVKENRGSLLSSVLILARAWWVAGCPKADIPTLGSFEKWAETVGGILDFAGVGGFLSNLDEFTDSQDEEASEWSAFFSNWSELFKEGPISTKDFLKNIGKFDSLPEDIEKLLSNDGKISSQKVGKLFQNHKDVVYEVEGKKLRFERAKDETHNKVALWIVKVR